MAVGGQEACWINHFQPVVFLVCTQCTKSTKSRRRFACACPPTVQQVPVEAALEAIRGRLLGTRLSLVTAAFTRLRGSGDAPPDAAAAVNVAVQFVPTGHPDVIAGRRTPEARKYQNLPAPCRLFYLQCRE